MRNRHRAGIAARVMLGIIFVAAGLGKVFSNAESTKVLFNPFLPNLEAVFTQLILTWLPRIEVIIGLLLIIGIAVKLMAITSAFFLTAFVINNSWLLSQGLGYEPCTCFGILDKIVQAELSTIGSLILDIIMLGLVLVIMFCCTGKILSIHPWLTGENEATQS